VQPRAVNHGMECGCSATPRHITDRALLARASSAGSPGDGVTTEHSILLSGGERPPRMPIRAPPRTRHRFGDEIGCGGDLLAARRDGCQPRPGKENPRRETPVRSSGSRDGGPAGCRGDCAGLWRDRRGCCASLRDDLRSPSTLPPATRCWPRSSGRGRCRHELRFRRRARPPRRAVPRLCPPCRAPGWPGNGAAGASNLLASRRNAASCPSPAAPLR
jgi:hypothetical protein